MSQGCGNGVAGQALQLYGPSSFFLFFLLFTQQNQDNTKKRPLFCKCFLGRGHPVTNASLLEHHKLYQSLRNQVKQKASGKQYIIIIKDFHTLIIKGQDIGDQFFKSHVESNDNSISAIWRANQDIIVSYLQLI